MYVCCYILRGWDVCMLLYTEGVGMYVCCYILRGWNVCMLLYTEGVECMYAAID